MGQHTIRATVDLRLAGTPDEVAQAVERLSDRLAEAGCIYDDDFEALHGKC